MAILNKGDRGAAVILLQGVLHRLNYAITNVDGIFGGETEEAVREFQTSMGLDVDGKVGEETANAIVSEVWALGYDDNAMSFDEGEV